MKTPELPQAFFGSADPEDVDWRQAEDEEEDPDDEELEETPADVVEMLGFDPTKESN